MNTTNVKLYRTAYVETSPTQGTNEPRRDATEAENSGGHSVYQAACSANQANFPRFSHCQAYLPNQVNSRGHPRYQSSHHSFSSSPSTNTRDVHSLNQVQDKKGKQTSHQTIRSSVYLQQKMQREETGSPKRRIASSNKSVTTLPPIQQPTRHTTDHSRQSHAPAEQRNQVLPVYARRCGRQEVSEVRNSESCRSRRIGVCKETDTSGENRTFVRMLEKRF